MDLGLDVDESHPPMTVITVVGEIDVSTAPSLHAQLVDLLAQGKVNLVVDLEGVDFLDSTALGVLVSAVKRMRNDNGDLTLVCTQPHILNIFEITGLTKVFAIHDSLDAALAG